MEDQTRALLPAMMEARDQFMKLVDEIRPELHRYCARMTGSIFDGEDVVQESLAKAYYALGQMVQPPNLKPWLFRIAHNTAMDFIKRYDRQHVEPVADVPDRAEREESGVDPALVEAALTVFAETAADAAQRRDSQRRARAIARGNRTDDGNDRRRGKGGIIEGTCEHRSDATRAFCGTGAPRRRRNADDAAAVRQSLQRPQLGWAPRAACGGIAPRGRFASATSSCRGRGILRSLCHVHQDRRPSRGGWFRRRGSGNCDLQAAIEPNSRVFRLARG